MGVQRPAVSCAHHRPTAEGLPGGIEAVGGRALQEGRRAKGGGAGGERNGGLLAKASKWNEEDWAEFSVSVGGCLAARIRTCKPYCE